MRLAAGSLSLDVDGGNIGGIYLGNVELIRGIAFLVRGPDWATLAPNLSALEIAEDGQGTQLRWQATVQNDGAVLSWSGALTLTPDGLDIMCEATTLSGFRTCRTGFVVLHPASAAGLQVRLEHTDGRVEDTRFPDLLAPWQPMFDIRALTHEPAPGVLVVCRMDGDTFEMEDQRNWTDASFKTYVRPLSRPWPYEIAAGEVVRQSVSLRVSGTAPRIAADRPVTISLAESIGPVPPVGLACTDAEARAALSHIESLRALGAGILVHRHDPRVTDSLDAVASLAQALGIPVELQIVLCTLNDVAGELAEAAQQVRRVGLKLASIAVSPVADLKSTPPGQPWPEAPDPVRTIAAARAAFPGTMLGGGMFTYFTELNRKPPPSDLVDYVTFSTGAIVHAADDLSVMQTLETLPAIMRSAAVIAAGKPLHVGPTTIAMRENPYGTATLPNPEGVLLAMTHQDPRQRTTFAAAWTAGAMARLIEGGAAQVVPASVFGDTGLFDQAGLYPAYAVVQAVARARGRPARRAVSSDPAKLLAIALGDELMSANLTNAPLSLHLPDGPRTLAAHDVLFSKV